MRKRKCLHCKNFFYPDLRNVNRQKYCSNLACRKASRKASQKRWLNKPQNRDYFRSADNVARVQKWRKDNPGYWKRAKQQNALQDPINPESVAGKGLGAKENEKPLQELLISQSPVIIGLIAHLTGFALQDDIAKIARNLQNIGLDVLNTPNIFNERGELHEISNMPGKIAQNPQAVQLDRPPSGT